MAQTAPLHRSGRGRALWKSETHVGLQMSLVEQGARAQQGLCLHGAALVVAVQLALVLLVWQHEPALWLGLAQGLQARVLQQNHAGCGQEQRLGCLRVLSKWLLKLLR